jgi:hypothetical protein
MVGYNPSPGFYANLLFCQGTPSAQEIPILDEVFLLEYIESSNFGSPTGRTCEKKREIPPAEKCDD